MVRKFKHKKTGTIAEQTDYNKNLYYLTVNNGSLGTQSKDFIEDSNDWEEIKPEYTILKLQAKKSFNRFTTDYIDIERAIKDNFSLWNIHSVRRELDGEVFTIGDECFSGKILSIEINNNDEIIISTITNLYNINQVRKVKPKEWEITAFMHQKNIYTLTNENYGNGKVWRYLGGFLQENTYHLLSDIEIYSVKRLSDGEEFKIGDKVSFDDGSGKETIEKLYIDSNFQPPQLRWSCKQSTYPFSFIGKHLKQPLFTTEDGVDIYEGNKYVMLDISNWSIDITGGKGLNEKDYRIYFSTKEKAEQYILMNKPCLSLNDITLNWVIEEKKVHGSKTFNKLTELVKQKLKQD